MESPSDSPPKQPDGVASAGTTGGAALAQPEDAELVLRAQAGDRKAFARLVERHQQQIYRLALRMLGNEAEAEEILQEAFLHAFENLGEFRRDAAFGSWVYRIAANSALMRLRRRRRSPEQAAGDTLQEPVTGPQFGPDGGYVSPPRSDWSVRADEALHNRQLGEALRQAVANLPESYRVVFLLKDVDGLSNEQIGELLGLSIPAVKSRLHRARLALREQLGEFFHAG